MTGAQLRPWAAAALAPAAELLAAAGRSWDSRNLQGQSSIGCPPRPSPRLLLSCRPALKKNETEVNNVPMKLERPQSAKRYTKSHCLLVQEAGGGG